MSAQPKPHSSRSPLYYFNLTMDHMSVHNVNRRSKHTGWTSNFFHNYNTQPRDNVKVSSGRFFPPLAPSPLLIGFTCSRVYDSTQLTPALEQLCKQHLCVRTFSKWSVRRADNKDTSLLGCNDCWMVTSRDALFVSAANSVQYKKSTAYAMQMGGGGGAPSKRISVLTNRH
jgi:hypothetical protein